MRNIYRAVILFLFVIILVSVIAFARGYRYDAVNQTITSTGILAVSANQRASSIYINGKLKGVTDTNLTLPPGKYKVEVKKEGYTSWSQDVTLRGEIVMSLDALLFPKNPSLSPMTNSGVVKALNIDQTGKVLLFVQNNEIEKDGLYIFDTNQHALSFLPPLKPVILISKFPDKINLKDTNIYFSPDYTRAIFDYTVDENTKSYFISLDQSADPLDITASKQTFLEAWKQERNKDITKILETFPIGVQKVASSSFEIISFSPDETKMLYKSINTNVIPPVLKSPMIGSNQASEERTLQKDHFYIYDKKEDKNLPFNVLTQKPALENQITPRVPIIKPKPTIGSQTAEDIQRYLTTDYNEPATNSKVLWYPDSHHLILMENSDIVIVDYDGTNKRTVYSGPFEKTFFGVNSSEDLIILTNLNPQNNPSADLYGVGI